MAFDGIPLDEVSTSMTINAPASVLLLALRAGGRGAGRGQRGPARHGPERHPQGVHRARELHLPARAVDAAHHGPVRLLRRAHPEVEHGVDLRLPLPREGLLGRPGGRVHAGQRHGLRAGGARRRPRGRRLRSPPGLLLQRPQQRLPGGGQVPRRPQHVGARDEGPLRRAGPEARRRSASTPRPAASRSPPSSRSTTSSASPCRASPPSAAAPSRCTPTATTRRSRCRASAPPRSPCARSRSSPTSPAPQTRSTRSPAPTTSRR